MNSFVGKYNQTVPKYSAVSVNGKRLYKYARADSFVELPKREVEVKEIELISYKDDNITFKCKVSKGTYIRSLIKDICNKLGVLGTMSDLVRTKQGKFNIEDSYKIVEIENGNYNALKLENVLDLKIIELTDDLNKKVSNGNKLELNYDGYVLFRKNDKDIALYYFENNLGKLKIMF